jgi:hypothetical protein
MREQELDRNFAQRVQEVMSSVRRLVRLERLPLDHCVRKYGVEVKGL